MSQGQPGKRTLSPGKTTRPMGRVVLFAIAGTVVVALITASFVVISVLPAAVRGHAEEHLEAASVPLAGIVAVETSGESRVDLSSVLDRYLRNPFVSRIVLIDRDGNFVADSDEGAPVPQVVLSRLAVPRDFSAATLRAGDGAMIRIEPISPGPVDTSLPWGVLIIIADPSFAMDHFGRLIAIAVAVFLTVLILSHVSTLLLINRLALLPLREIAAAIRNRNLARVDVLSTTTSISEISELTGSFLFLVRENEQAKKRLRDHAERLEETVSERTRDLNSKEQALMAHEKYASLGRLAAGIAHEINNPTGYVSSNLDTLDDYFRKISELQPIAERAIASYQEGDPEAGRAAVRELEDAHRRLDMPFIREDLPLLISGSREGMARIRDLVWSLRSYAGNDEAPLEDVNLAEIVADALKMTRNELRYDYQVLVSLRAQPTIRANRTKLVQVFVNLLVNARDATPPGGEIAVELQRDGAESCRVTVGDTGAGMDEETRRRIFDPFFTTKPPGSGTGLGLALVNATVREAGGEITVESQPGEGTTFTLIFPARYATWENTGAAVADAEKGRAG